MSLEPDDISDEEFELFNREIEDYIRCDKALDAARKSGGEEAIEKALEAMAKHMAESKWT